jgi:hypothetical protein
MQIEEQLIAQEEASSNPHPRRHPTVQKAPSLLELRQVQTSHINNGFLPYYVFLHVIDFKSCYTSDMLPGVVLGYLKFNSINRQEFWFGFGFSLCGGG